MAKRNPRSPRGIDFHLGNRLREAREAQDMSQSALADMLGITFQQIQKYERGTNRISASRLYEAAHALELPVMFSTTA